MISNFVEIIVFDLWSVAVLLACYGNRGQAQGSWFNLWSTILLIMGSPKKVG